MAGGVSKQLVAIWHYVEVAVQHFGAGAEKKWTPCLIAQSSFAMFNIRGQVILENGSWRIGIEIQAKSGPKGIKKQP
jgi:hypothetical protein